MSFWKQQRVSLLLRHYTNCWNMNCHYLFYQESGCRLPSSASAAESWRRIKPWRRKADTEGRLRLHDRTGGQRRRWASVKRRRQLVTKRDRRKLSLWPQTASTTMTTLHQTSLGASTWMLKLMSTHRNSLNVQVSKNGTLCCLNLLEFHKWSKPWRQTNNNMYLFTKYVNMWDYELICINETKISCESGRSCPI